MYRVSNRIFVVLLCFYTIMLCISLRESKPLYIYKINFPLYYSSPFLIENIHLGNYLLEAFLYTLTVIILISTRN